MSFKVIHSAVTTFRSSFGEFSASFDAAARKFTGSVKVESLQCFQMLRDRLFEEDFFDAANYPQIRFESTSIEPVDDHLVIEGDLTMKGVTNRVRATGIVLGTAPVFHAWTKTVHEHFGIDLHLVIDRREFGVSFNNELPNGLANLGYEVAIELALDFAQAEPIESGAGVSGG